MNINSSNTEALFLSFSVECSSAKLLEVFRLISQNNLFKKYVTSPVFKLQCCQGVTNYFILQRFLLKTV